jgi:phosphatidylglycerophosphate synthase
MTGLYALKPWYGARLAGVRRGLIAHRVSPNVLTVAGVGFGAAAGAAIAFLRPGLIAAVLVGVLLAARLACANLDGAVARAAGTGSRFGFVSNELGDRLAEFAALAGVLALTGPAVVCGAALAGTLPSWVALAGAGAGGARVQGGPVGKTERAALLVVLAGTGWVMPILAVYALGSVVTAVLRAVRVHRELS